MLLKVVFSLSEVLAKGSGLVEGFDIAHWCDRT